jgi:two-component system NtrC family sensor kinase
MVKANLEGITHQQDAKLGLKAIKKRFLPFLPLALQRKWQKSQVSTLTLFVGTVLILAVAATTSYRIIYKLLITSSEEQALLKVKQGGNEIDYWLEKCKNEVSTIADTPTAKTMNWSVVGPYFKSQVTRLKEYEHLTMALPNGRYFTTEVGEAKAKMNKRPWFKLAMKGLIATSDPAMSQTVHNIHIIVVAPIKSDAGKIIGAVAGAVGINRPVQGVQSLEFGQGSYAFTLNSAGEVIFHPALNIKGAITSSASNLFTTKNSSLSDIARQMLKGEDQIKLFKIDGSWKYVAYVHLKEANWFLALVIPPQTIESPLYSLNLLATILGTLMLIAIFGTWRQIQLSQIAKAIAQQKSLLYAQTQKHVELLDQSLQERQAIEHVLRTQTK